MSVFFCVQVDIPQHPVDLHGIVTRGTKELSSTLQEFRGVRILQRGTKPTTISEDQTDHKDAPHGHGRSSPKFQMPEQQLPRSPVEDSKLIKPLVMQFHLVRKYHSDHLNILLLGQSVHGNQSVSIKSWFWPEYIGDPNTVGIRKPGILIPEKSENRTFSIPVLEW
jgi:hypothetical protein